MTNPPSKIWEKNSHRNLWQHPLWKKFQENIGRKSWLIEKGGASALIVKHTLPKGLSWLEIPRGPLFENEKCLQEILEKIKAIGKKEKSIFVRFSPYEAFQLSTFNFQLSKFDHHPEASLVINLSQTEDEILSQMKPKGRYNIRLAGKRGVTVKPSKDIDGFYGILKETGNRDGFGIHPKKYYQKMLESMGENAQLLLAYHENKVVGGGIFIYLDEWGIYYYGASSYKHRHLMAPYAIQWEAIKESKERGMKYYDFLGISAGNDPRHNWWGVTHFKKKFGGEVKIYPQAKELVLRPFLYWLYKAYKKLK